MSDLDDVAGDIRPNQVVVGVGAEVWISLYASTATNVVFDLAGFFVEELAVLR